MEERRRRIKILKSYLYGDIERRLVLLQAPAQHLKWCGILKRNLEKRNAGSGLTEFGKKIVKDGTCSARTFMSLR